MDQGAGLSQSPADSAPLRTALLGSGRQAGRIAEALTETRALVLVGVASPRLLDESRAASRARFGTAAAYAEPERMLDELRPECAIIAATTPAHAALTLACAARGIAVLVEKPFASTLEAADAMCAAAERSLVVPAHVMAEAPGVRTLFAAAAIRRPRLVGATGGPDAARETLVVGSLRRFSARAGEARHGLWPSGPDERFESDELYEVLYHSVYLVAAALGDASEELAVESVRLGRGEREGDLEPGSRYLSARLLAPTGGRAHIELRLGEAEDSSTLWIRRSGGQTLRFHRAGRNERLDRYSSLPLLEAGSDGSDGSGGGDGAPLPVEGVPIEQLLAPRGGERPAMLAHFAARVREQRPQPDLARAARETMRTTAALVEKTRVALLSAGAIL